MPGDDPDRELWQQAQKGDRRAFDRLRSRHTGFVYGRIARYTCVGYDDREDIVQEVWRAVWQSLFRFLGESTFVTWLGGVARNVIFEYLRRTVQMEHLVEPLHEERTAAVEPLAAEWTDHVALHIATRNLPEEDREVLCWCFDLQLTEEEAAEQIGIPLGTLKSRKRAALKRLRVTYEGTEEGEDKRSRAGKAAGR